MCLINKAPLGSIGLIRKDQMSFYGMNEEIYQVY